MALLNCAEKLGCSALIEAPMMVGPYLEENWANWKHYLTCLDIPSTILMLIHYSEVRICEKNFRIGKKSFVLFGKKIPMTLMKVLESINWKGGHVRKSRKSFFRTKNFEINTNYRKYQESSLTVFTLKQHIQQLFICIKGDKGIPRDCRLSIWR